MTVIEDSGLPEAELDVVLGALRRDPALEPELELILPALSAEARNRFWIAFARGARGGRRPAAGVLDALVEAGRGVP